MVAENSPFRAVAIPLYNQSLLVAPNGEIVQRWSLPVQSQARDTQELKDIQSAERRRKIQKEASASAKYYKFELHLAWFLLKKICGIGCDRTPKYKSTPIKVGYGLIGKQKNFTKKAQRQLRYGAAAMERHLGKERCKFVTFTVPGSTPEAMRVVAQWSGWLVNRIKQWIKDNFTHSDGKQYVIGVAEYQPQRGMLHWHFLVGLESFFYYEKFKAGIETLWYELLCQLSKISRTNLFKSYSGVNWQHRWKKIKHRAVRVENVNKSVSNYLAKYLSKNPYKNVNEAQWRGRKYKVYPPSAWYTRSQDVIDLIAEYTIRYDLNPTIPTMLEEIVEFSKNIYNSFGFWVVDTIHPYTKEKIGIIARGKYEDAVECAGILAGIINEMGRQCRQIVDNHQKQWHSENFRVTKELHEKLQLEQFYRYLDWENTPSYMRRKSDELFHKQYWDAIKNGRTMQEAFACAGMD